MNQRSMEDNYMLYQFLSLPDETEISYSEIIKDDNGHDSIRIYIEKWNEIRNDFDCLELYLHSFKITKHVGFSSEVVSEHIRHLKNLENVIWDVASDIKTAVCSFPSCMEHCGQYPVIKINLNGIYCYNRNDLVAAIAGAVNYAA